MFVFFLIELKMSTQLKVWYIKKNWHNIIDRQYVKWHVSVIKSFFLNATVKTLFSEQVIPGLTGWFYLRKCSTNCFFSKVKTDPKMSLDHL